MHGPVKFGPSPSGEGSQTSSLVSNHIIRRRSAIEQKSELSARPVQMGCIAVLAFGGRM